MTGMVYRDRSELGYSAKFCSILVCFLVTFLLNVQSIRYYSHASILINVPYTKLSLFDESQGLGLLTWGGQLTGEKCNGGEEVARRVSWFRKRERGGGNGGDVATVKVAEGACMISLLSLMTGTTTFGTSFIKSPLNIQVSPPHCSNNPERRLRIRYNIVSKQAPTKEFPSEWIALHIEQANRPTVAIINNRREGPVRPFSFLTLSATST
ncbi:hypothetical protein LguiA_026549 [Lonicera macranthoides]